MEQVNLSILYTRFNNVTEHPTAEWTARQLIEACGREESARHLIRDRDQVYGERFSRQANLLDIREAVIAPRSPWQNAYAERVIGSIRRECLDHVVVIGDRHLLRILSTYVAYYNGTRTTYRWPRTRPSRGVCSHRFRAGWWRCRASVGSITNTRGGWREPLGRISGRHRSRGSDFHPAGWAHGPINILSVGAAESVTGGPDGLVPDTPIGYP